MLASPVKKKTNRGISREDNDGKKRLKTSPRGKANR